MQYQLLLEVCWHTLLLNSDKNRINRRFRRRKSSVQFIHPSCSLYILCWRSWMIRHVNGMTLKMKTMKALETSVTIYQQTMRHTPEAQILHQHSSETSTLALRLPSINSVRDTSARVIKNEGRRITTPHLRSSCRVILHGRTPPPSVLHLRTTSEMI